MVLNTAQSNILKNASVTAIKANFSKIISNINSNRWLKINNRYANDIIRKIGIDTYRQTRNYKNKEINEYIASSIIIHCMDAWSYFGRAISSLLNGDSKIAMHLLYYSELRSVISILASQGIGVFHNRHFVVKSKDRCELLRDGGTHDFTWLAFQHWIKEMNASSILRQLIQIEKKSLDLWLDNFGVQGAMKDKVSKNFLLSIGFDLALFKKDRDARNEVSYRPTTIKRSLSINYKKILNEIKICWQLCEPNPKSSLQKIDNILLKKLLQVTFKATHPKGRSHKQNSKQFKNKIKIMLYNLGLSEKRIIWWLNYFSNNDLSEEVFLNIDTYKDIKNINYIFGMLYRSLFLLRISSAFCEENIIDNPSLTKNEFKFWWKNIGFNAGLWSNCHDITYFGDLWDDICIEIENLDLWISQEKGDVNNYRLQNDNKISTLRLSSFERVCLWSIGI